MPCSSSFLRAGPVGLALFLCASPSLAASASPDLSVSSRVEAVTLYPDRARITRHAAVELPAGQGRLILTGLPAGLQPDSLRLRARAAGEVVFGGVALGREVGSELLREDERLLTEQIRTEQQARRAQEDIRRAAQMRLEAIAALARAPLEPPSPQGEARAGLPPEAWPKAWEALDAGTRAALATQREADEAIRQHDEMLAALNKRLADIQSGQREMRIARVDFRAAQAGKVELELDYLIGKAGWRPLYEARLDTGKARLNLLSRAEIFQRGGEDWQEVELTVSTLRPAALVPVPELSSWEIGFERPSAKMEMAAPAPARMRAAQSPEAGSALNDERAVVEEQATLAGGEFNREFTVPGRVSLGSGAEQRTVLLEEHDLAAGLSARLAPRHRPRAVLVAQAPYTGVASLPPGPLALYLDGGFVGQVRLDGLRAGETLKFGFGEDPAIEVVFRDTPEARDTTGLIQRRWQLVRRYEARIVNHHARPIVLTVLDNIPVARDAQIRVELPKDITAPDTQDFDGHAGVLAWTRELAPGAVFEWRGGFRVDAPADKPVEGL
ncbi:MAG: mucoidy inhibitor MuiA family protein [Pseudomonadota bacterium]